MHHRKECRVPKDHFPGNDQELQDCEAQAIDGDDSHISSGIQPHLQIHHKRMTQCATKHETAQNVGIIPEEEENLLYYHRETEGLSSPADSTKHGMAWHCDLRSPQPISKLIPTKNDTISTKTETASQCSHETGEKENS